jgi:cobalt/nickel transport system permease protein
MHVSEGMLSGEVLAAGAALAAGGVGIGLRRMEYRKVPEVAMLASAFFVASLIHFPVGPGSIHLTLNGLLGLLLGWMAFPSVFIALALQAVVFQYGGLTTLGVNTVIVALPGVISYYALRIFVRKGAISVCLAAGALAGAAGVALGMVLMTLALVGTGEEFLPIMKVLALAHVPALFIEAGVSAFVVMFLLKVKPEVLGAGEA